MICIYQPRMSFFRLNKFVIITLLVNINKSNTMIPTIDKVSLSPVDKQRCMVTINDIYLIAILNTYTRIQMSWTVLLFT